MLFLFLYMKQRTLMCTMQYYDQYFIILSYFFPSMCTQI